MRKEYIFFVFIVLCMFSCKGKKGESSVVENESIVCNILGVSLNDNPYIIKEKLTKGGFHWEEYLSNNGLCIISLKEKFSFSGQYFEGLSFCALNAKLHQIHFRKDCDSLSLAQKVFDELSNKVIAKYQKFKVDKQNRLDSILVKSIEFDDGKTNLTIDIFHHENGEILSLYDEELKHRAREYWSVVIYYAPSEEGEKINKNDF